MKNLYEKYLTDDKFDNLFNVIKRFRIDIDYEKYHEDYC